MLSSTTWILTRQRWQTWAVTIYFPPFRLKITAKMTWRMSAVSRTVNRRGKFICIVLTSSVQLDIAGEFACRRPLLFLMAFMRISGYKWLSLVGIYSEETSLSVRVTRLERKASGRFSIVEMSDQTPPENALNSLHHIGEGQFSVISYSPKVSSTPHQLRSQIHFAPG